MRLLTRRVVAALALVSWLGSVKRAAAETAVMVEQHLIPRGEDYQWLQYGVNEGELRVWSVTTVGAPILGCSLLTIEGKHLTDRPAENGACQLAYKASRPGVIRVMVVMTTKAGAELTYEQTVVSAKPKR